MYVSNKMIFIPSLRSLHNMLKSPNIQYFISNDIEMNDKLQPDQPEKKISKKIRNIRLSKKELELLEEIRHGSLKKLIQMKVLPPLHPHTEKKKEKRVIKQCPEERLETSSSGADDTALMKISRSEELKNEEATAKFNFQGLQVQHCLTNLMETQSSHEATRNKKSNRSLKMTFGKQQGSCEIKDQSHRKKLFISPINPHLKNKAHLAKYEQIYKPSNRQNISNLSDKYVARYLQTPIEKAQHPRKQKISALPPLRPKIN